MHRHEIPSPLSRNRGTPAFHPDRCNRLRLFPARRCRRPTRLLLPLHQGLQIKRRPIPVFDPVSPQTLQGPLCKPTQTPQFHLLLLRKPAAILPHNHPVAPLGLRMRFRRKLRQIPRLLSKRALCRSRELPPARSQHAPRYQRCRRYHRRPPCKLPPRNPLVILLGHLCFPHSQISTQWHRLQPALRAGHPAQTEATESPAHRQPRRRR